MIIRTTASFDCFRSSTLGTIEIWYSVTGTVNKKNIIIYISVSYKQILERNFEWIFPSNPPPLVSARGSKNLWTRIVAIVANDFSHYAIITVYYEGVTGCRYPETG